jgi:FkbM family methyltransferase
VPVSNEKPIPPSDAPRSFWRRIVKNRLFAVLKGLKQGGSGESDDLAKRLRDLSSQVDDAITRLKEGRLLPKDISLPSHTRMDGDVAWVSGMIKSGKMHEPDYAVFSRFTPEMGTILDVGANWGYSVGSIRAAGCNAPILSFEVLTSYASCLQAVKETLGKGYDYIMSGVGSESGEIEFTTPVINGMALSALTSARTDEFGAGIASNIITYAKDYLHSASHLDFTFLVTKAPVDRIDSLLKKSGIVVSTDRIAAMKIDIEGFEAQGLSGAAETIARDKPFLMIEGGNRDPRVDQILSNADYKVAEFRDGQLVLSIGSSESANGFFVHASRVAHYLEIGILA